jgi:hypothetical protein
MGFRSAWVGVLVSASVVACGMGRGTDRAAAGTTHGATVTVPAASAPSGGTTPASTRTTGGPAVTGGVPPGYIGRTDDSTKSISGVSYTAVGDGMWDVQTGTHDQNLAHIMYSPLDTAHGVYTVKTEIDQLSAPLHPEAAGVFIGGRDLAGPDQRYAYFLVRGDGEYSIKVRRGRKASILVPFTASPGVPPANAVGRATYAIAIAVASDSVRFLVNGQPVAAVGRASIPTDGVAGIRVNHGLHLMVKPLVIAS